MTSFSVDLTESLTLRDTLGVTAGYALAMTQNAAASGSLSYAWAAGAAIYELVRVTDTYGTGTTFAVSMAELALMGSVLQAAIGVNVSENATVTDFLNGATVAFILERAKLSGAPLATGTFHMDAVQAATTLDTYLALANWRVQEGATLTSALAATYVASVDIVQNLLAQTFMDDFTSMVFNPIMVENVTISDIELLQAIYRGDPILETAYASVAYCSPDSSVTTWVINTRTNAITEYVNWSFNSFASVGRKYIAANSGGLYELNGERDVVSDIVARAAGGYMQFNASHLSGLKGVYLGMKGEGQYFMKITAGDERVYLYQFKSQPGLMTSKINIGKGLRSRYLQWELVSTGPDFDLDAIEFVPMVSDRRV